MATLLVTGFEPFDVRGYNTSSLVLGHLPPAVGHLDVVTATLPVHWRHMAPRLTELLSRHRPVLAVGLGMSKQHHLGLERLAVNFCGADRLDNDKRPPPSEAVVEEGPIAYRTDLPLEAMRSGLQTIDLPGRISGSAGDFLCNAVFYRLMHARHRASLVGLAGFIHVPPLERDGGWPLEKLAKAVLRCLDIAANTAQAEIFSFT